MTEDDRTFAAYLMDTGEDITLAEYQRRREVWRSSGGEFHGPNVETGSMPESELLPIIALFAPDLGSLGRLRREYIVYGGSDGPHKFDDRHKFEVIDGVLQVFREPGGDKLVAAFAPGEWSSLIERKWTEPTRTKLGEGT